MSETLPTWTVDTGDAGKCACFCPESPVLTVLYSSEDADGHWGPFFAEESPFSDNEGGVRIMMTYTGAGLDGYFVRGRVLTIHSVPPGIDGYEFGEDVRFEQTDGASAGTLLVNGGTYYEIPKTTVENDEALLVGPPGKANVFFLGNRQEQQFTKQGMAAFSGATGEVAKLYKLETVSGDAPGFPVVSGNCEFTPLTNNQGITDPTGTFTKTDGVNDGRYARPPVGYIGLERTYGQVIDNGPTRDMSDGTHSLGILLALEYTTAELDAAVQDSLDIQRTDAIGALDEGVVSKHFASADERTLWRVESQMQFEIGEGRAFAGNLATINIEVSYKLLTVDLFSGLQTPSTATQGLTVTVHDPEVGGPQGRAFTSTTGPVFLLPSGDNAEIWLTDIQAVENPLVVRSPVPSFAMELPPA